MKSGFSSLIKISEGGGLLAEGDSLELMLWTKGGELDVNRSSLDIV